MINHDLKTERDCITLIGKILSSVSFKFQNESELQKGIAELFTINKIPFEREYRLNIHDRPDFYIVLGDHKIALEVKVAGTKNNLLRQVARYLQHESVTCTFVVGTPYWVRLLPHQLSDKNVYCYRINSVL